MEDLIIPVYIFHDRALLATGDAAIMQIKGRYYGSFDFDVTYLSSEINEIKFPMCVVHGSLATHYAVGDVIFTRNGKEFVGQLEFKDDDYLHQIMPDVRSVTNIG